MEHPEKPKHHKHHEHKQHEQQPAPPPGKDLYRDTLVRYLGYANEVGESFRPLVPKVWVHGSYVVSVSYVLADTLDKSKKCSAQGGSTGRVMATAADVLIWQMLASVMIPGFTINRITYFSSKALSGAAKKSGSTFLKFLPTAIGLCSIPLIIHPIDHLVDALLDNTIRRLYK